MTDQQRPLAIALVVSLLLHGVVLWAALRWKPAPKPRPPQRVTLQVAVATPRQAPPPAAKPTPPPEPARTTKPDPRPAPAPQAPRTPALTTTAPAAVAVAPAPPEPPPPGPPQHKMKAAGSAAATASGSAGSTGRKGAVYAPPEYAEKVKQRVNAAIVYPADAKRFLQQCWVEYTLTVDRNGNMMGAPKIENCGDDRLDAAAYAALLKGSPYPPPPDTGASSYEIHGAIVFTLR